ncbi:DUF7288 family protein [Halalkalirubrum salinum]|uniref:DUF7288 family protein n=1 Tax=Halalkalirubrum salinum TaxID=2563889 RepID=UPI0010FBB453|nr:hypothetical protein [Halalkalirubrum salinum]
MNRGQAHTLEAFVAVLLLVSGIIFALQATAVTPLSASTSNQQIENQQRAIAADILAAADSDGSLKEATLCRYPASHNETPRQFVGTDENQTSFVEGGPPSECGGFGPLLNETYDDRGIAYNVRVYTHLESGGMDDVNGSLDHMVDMGSPTDNAVTAGRTVVLYENDTLITDDNVTVAESGLYQDRSATERGQIHAVIEVEVTVWRM